MEEENIPSKKVIRELEGYKFFIPSYQRGYRWTEYEVKELLEDILEFSDKDDQKYCIQPLIVKKREDGLYEVVDGQQRLTTIYIFMKIVQQDSPKRILPFELDYETRKGSKKFLEELNEENYHNQENIDFYHMGMAYKTINNWLDEQEYRSDVIDELYTKIRKSVFFIWYEMPENRTDTIEMFTKVNLGKIPLTNAELIKALILNKENFNEDIEKKQIEISIEWDKIEQELQKEEFWLFLTNRPKEKEAKKGQTGTNIDLLFKLLADEYKNEYEVYAPKEKEYFPFLVFYEILKNKVSNKEEFVLKLWSSVKKIYEELREWYNDINKYHIIGYLIETGTTIKEIREKTKRKEKK